MIWLWLAACTVQERGPDVQLWHAYQGAEEQALIEAADAWSEAEGIGVDVVFVPFGSFDSKVETAVPRDNGPDLWISAHANLGKWTSMDLPAEATPGEGFRAVTLDALTQDGKVWAYPLAFKSPMLLYDPEVVRDPPETTDELVALARQLREGERYGLAYTASEAYYHAAWLHGFGGALGGDARLDSDAAVQALEFVDQLEDVLPPQVTGERVASLYNEGHAAMVVSGPWFAADAQRPIAATSLPVVSATGEPAQPYLTVEAAWVSSRSAQPEVAHSLAAFLAGPEGARVRQDTGGQAVAWAQLTSDDPIVAAQVKQAATAVPMPTDPNVQPAFEAQNRALRQVMRGVVTPPEAAKAAQSTYEVLSRPPPPAVSPWPYLALMVLVLGGLVGWFGRPLLDADVRRNVWTHRWDYVWIAPAAFAMTVLVVTPFVTGAGVSLFAHHYGEWRFVGVHHFLDILLARDWPISSPMSFVYTLVVTVLWTVCNVALHVAIGVGLAMLLREPWIRLRAMWRALLIIPWAVPNYITALIWKSMFDTQHGAINAMLSLPLSDPVEIDWFASFATGFTANLVTNTWLGFPFMMVVTLGALQSIPRDLEEAAEVDGASAWFRFRHVVWPMLQPALLPAVILGSVWTFNMFNVVYLVSAGEPDGSTEILISEAYRWAFSRGNRYGYASAYAVLIFGVLVLYARGANRLAGRKVL